MPVTSLVIGPGPRGPGPLQKRLFVQLMLRVPARGRASQGTRGPCPAKQGVQGKDWIAAKGNTVRARYPPCRPGNLAVKEDLRPVT